MSALVDLPDPGRFPGPRPAVVICHDVEGADHGFLPHLATLLAERGFVTVRVDAVPEELDLAGLSERIDGSRLGLFGHGEGGGDALRAAAGAGQERVRALVTWAAAADPDLLAAAGRRTAPWLLVHGAADESVAAEDAHRLTAAAAAPTELLVIPGASHTFGARHPFAGPTPQLIQALNATQRWFRRFL
jgi:dienelactone hydrolase